MKNIIKTDNYLLIVSDEEIKEGDWFTDDNNSLKRSYKLSHVQFANPKKIIAHLSLNNSRILEGVDLLPPLEDEVDKLSADYTEEWCGKRKVDVYIHDAFKAGYNKAKEKYKYTEEDIDKAYWAGMKFVGEDKGSYKEFIQSLQQPKYPIGFECEMEKDFRYNDDGEKIGLPVHETNKPKTTTNSQGQTVLFGKYIYE